jgi:hypothetical protein
LVTPEIFNDKEAKSNNIENGLDFILNHFNQNRLFPRTIMTKNLGYQKEVFSKEEAMKFFEESDFIDCRINAFPSFTDYKGIQRYPPDFIFIDLDKSNFKTNRSFEVALSNTLKNIGEKLEGDAYPSVLFTGNGYHIYQPVYYPTVLENVTEFSKLTDKPSQEFLRFAKNFLSNGKADQSNNPSFKSCLLRIPNSINSKNNTVVKIIQQWNGYSRPTITKELLLDFRRYLIQKKINEYNYRQRQQQKQKRNYNYNYLKNNHTSYYYEWIDKKILANQFEDYRKIIINLILAPYLIVIKKLSFEDSYQIIYEWLQKCDLLRKLNFNIRDLVNTALVTAYKKQIPPMSIITLKTNYKDLYFLLV